MLNKIFSLFFTILPAFIFALDPSTNWQLGPFKRVELLNPILLPNRLSLFHCPIQNKDLHWEGEHLFNPGAVVSNGIVHLIYRAEDDFGNGIGNHTSRLGLAESKNGVHFQRYKTPILFPDFDDQKIHEFPGGCEDPRIVEAEDGTFIMTYTQWNRQVAILAVATSKDLKNWQKHGYVFEGKADRAWSKSGSIVCRCVGDRMIAAKIQDKYWMYWGEGSIHVATSDDLISWEPLRDQDGQFVKVLEPRIGKFDSLLVEPGPPALLTNHGIVLLYNGKNSESFGDPTITSKAYSAGQVLFDMHDPTKMLDRTDKCFLTPERSYEMRGQYKGGTVFVQGLVHFRSKWLLYYGMADSSIGVAVSLH